MDRSYRSGTNTLGIIFFCLAFGTVLGSVGERAKPVIEFWLVIDEVIMRMVCIIMWISPVGISSVICAKEQSETSNHSFIGLLGVGLSNVVRCAILSDCILKILAVDDLTSVMSQLGLFVITVCSGIFIYQFTILQVSHVT